MAKISKSGIGPHQQIKSEHIIRIIDALSGESRDTDIEISGSIVLHPTDTLPISASAGTLTSFITGSDVILNYYDGKNWIPLF
jgi:L-asparaginase/Glu-tRNA(Gln) amidotransferase subunit D